MAIDFLLQTNGSNVSFALQNSGGVVGFQTYDSVTGPGGCACCNTSSCCLAFFTATYNCSSAAWNTPTVAGAANCYSPDANGSCGSSVLYPNQWYTYNVSTGTYLTTDGSDAGNCTVYYHAVYNKSGACMSLSDCPAPTTPSVPAHVPTDTSSCCPPPDCCCGSFGGVTCTCYMDPNAPLSLTAWTFTTPDGTVVTLNQGGTPVSPVNPVLLPPNACGIWGGGSFNASGLSFVAVGPDAGTFVCTNFEVVLNNGLPIPWATLATTSPALLPFDLNSHAFTGTCDGVNVVDQTVVNGGDTYTHVSLVATVLDNARCAELDPP